MKDDQSLIQYHWFHSQDDQSERAVSLRNPFGSDSPVKVLVEKEPHTEYLDEDAAVEQRDLYRFVSRHSYTLVFVSAPQDPRGVVSCLGLCLTLTPTRAWLVAGSAAATIANTVDTQRPTIMTYIPLTSRPALRPIQAPGRETASALACSRRVWGRDVG
jgi:hypothetical protein